VQGKRNFTSGKQDDSALGDDLDNIEDPLYFDQLSDHLIASAAPANDNQDVGDGELQVTITVPTFKFKPNDSVSLQASHGEGLYSP